MINILLFGPPGAGKGTQAAKIVDAYDLLHISTGDLFRYNLKNETELGKLAKSYMDKGELVPDEVTINMLQDKVNQNLNVRGYIFDGFPRTVPQAEALDQMLAAKGQSLTAVISLIVPDQEVAERLKKRAMDSGRADDADESIINNRIQVYKEETLPVAGHYAPLGKVKEIEGIGSIEVVFERICKAIDLAILEN